MYAIISKVMTMCLSITSVEGRLLTVKITELYSLFYWGIWLVAAWVYDLWYSSRSLCLTHKLFERGKL